LVISLIERDKLGPEENLILAGALASAALFLMPNSPVLWVAAGFSDYGRLY
jgi:hypothetical protein